MWEYTYGDELYHSYDELYHYGVPGMKWGHRKAQQYTNKAKNARASAKEWDEIGRHKAAKAQAKGNKAKADKILSKYSQKAKQDRADAKNYEAKAKTKERESKFQGKQAEVKSSRSTGAKLATNVLAGPFANRTYNSVIAAGGTKTGARVVTGLTALGGPLAHVVVSHLYTKSYGEKKTIRR